MNGSELILTSSGLCILLYVLLSLQHIAAQDDEPPPCSCTPIEYSWRLRFNGTCPEDGIMDIDGIHDHTCSIGSKSDNLIVEVVTDYTVLEFGTNLDDIAHSKKETDVKLYEDALITYESVTKNMPGIYSKGMIMIVEGLNAEDEKVQLYWAIHFTNDCNTIPKLGNYSLGWTTFDELEPARCQSCDAIVNKNIGPSGKKKKCKKVKIPKYKKSGKSEKKKSGKSKNSGKSKGKIKGKSKSKGKSIYGGKGKGKSKDVKEKHKSYKKGSGKVPKSKDEIGKKSKGKRYKSWKHIYSKSKKGKGSVDY